MKAFKSLIDNEFISFISFSLLLFLFLSFPYALEATDPDTSDQPNGQLTTVSLRHIFHHGSTKFPKLFRRMDLTESKVRAHEFISGTSFTHTVMGVNGTGIKYVKDNAVKEFRDISINEHKSTILDWRDIPKWLPAIKHWGTLINLAKITYNSYVQPEDDDWYDMGDKYHLNSSFGWDQDGVRGHVFVSSDNKTLIVSIKGTSMGFGAGPTVPSDKKNDNRLFSCCCAYVDRTWTPVCPCWIEGFRCNEDCLEDSVDEDGYYYDITLKMVDRIMEEYPKSHVWLTGHSLGGALSSLVGLSFNLPVVAYESPGDKLPAKRLHLPSSLLPEKMNIWHFGHTADPIYMGACNGRLSSCYIGGYAMESQCHVGLSCTFDSVGKLGWSVNIKNHRIKEVIDKILSVWWDLFKFFPDCEYDGKECDEDECFPWTYE